MSAILRCGRRCQLRGDNALRYINRILFEFGTTWRYIQIVGRACFWVTVLVVTAMFMPSFVENKQPDEGVNALLFYFKSARTVRGSSIISSNEYSI